jgi:uncharacterized protein YyaL (SSP411 family)
LTITAARTPRERQPFFGGTYFPQRQFLDVLQQLRRVYDQDPQRVAKVATQLTRAVQESAQPVRQDKVPGPEAIRSAVERLAGSYDAVHGEGRPKDRPIVREVSGRPASNQIELPP